MNITISEGIEKESFDKLIKALNENDNVTIYLNSRGGHIADMEAMINLINTHDHGIINIIGFGALLSSAFELFFRVKCKKEILPGTIGMIHQSSTAIDINEFGKATYQEGEAIMKQMKTYHRERTNLLCSSRNLTQSERNNVKLGKDVYFQYNRMLELLKP